MEELRPLLLSIAYRMLGTFGDAEDVVQEAYLRLHSEPEVTSPKSFLTTVTTRLAIDQLRSARRQREQYFGPWLPEPAVDEYVDLADRAALSDSLSTAFLVVLERLSPDQRAVFLLGDVFGYSYDDLAAILGKTPANCRQLAVRARRRIADNRPRFDPSPQERDELLRRFVAAAEDGNLEALVALLTPDATFTGDGGGKGGFPRPVHGAPNIARLVIGSFGKFTAPDDRPGGGPAGLRGPGALIVEVVHVGGQPALRIHDRADRTVAIWSFTIVDSQVSAIHGIVNPDKLTHLQP
ncbi:RNA polymerase sigma-70 factor (ECF subfamily) [Kribbella aluminosa]|uniref:RNA polymerase sigma-70 factor (ECF subfamily) n=1 Tax=Kribbella aluminosa TaxID=416017 RepID=A0ABS4UZ94_9ACTN|nr:RNA polymerase sigma factor SigJ [Kribbella aluminosa]MBP2356973.1 RNA polymerase sigma-70 factor (ECF subfamily) [Kribbella aluminosa]